MADGKSVAENKIIDAEMDENIIKIEICDKREKATTTIYVERISESKFRMIDNDIFNCQLTLGTEFETRINETGKHEITRITKKSEYITRRFMLTPQFKTADYQVLGDEIIKHGGFWQVDFGSIATINLPQNSTLDLYEIFRVFDFQPAEIDSDQ